MSWEVYTPSPWPFNERKAVLKVTKNFMDELSFNEESSELSSDNKEVSSDKEAALLGPLQPVQKQTESLSSDNVLLLIAMTLWMLYFLMRSHLMCPQITQQLSCSLYPARIEQSIPSPKGCMYCGEPPDHTTVWSGYYWPVIRKSLLTFAYRELLNYWKKVEKIWFFQT